MDLITLLLVVIILGIVVAVIRAAPIDEFFKMAAYGICAIILVLMLFGAMGYGPGIHFGR